MSAAAQVQQGPHQADWTGGVASEEFQDGPHGAEAVQPAALHQPHQERLGLVVGMMGDRDDRGLLRLRHPACRGAEEGVPCGPGGRFEPRGSAWSRSGSRMTSKKGRPHVRGQPGDEGGVLVCFRPQPMVDVGHLEGQAQPLCAVPEGVEQTDAVHAATYADHDGRRRCPWRRKESMARLHCHDVPWQGSAAGPGHHLG